MVSDTDEIAAWLFVICLGLMGVIVVLCNCDNAPRSGYFFVQSGSLGYAVMMDDSTHLAARITKYMSLDEAKKTCDSFNVTLGDKANK